MLNPVELTKLAGELASAMVDDILELWSLDEIRRLIEEMEAKVRKPH